MTELTSPQLDTPPSDRPEASRRRRIITRVVAGTVGAALVVGSATAFFVLTAERPVTDDSPAAVEVASVDGMGEVLVDGDGQALYIFEPDDAKDVTCTGGCAAKWPPLMVDAGAEPMVAAGIGAGRVGVIADQDGVDVATFDGWPLYRYTSDQLGQVTGSGRDQNGGTWWALTPSGERIRP
uniref:Putative lipoprotein n=2 Tax=Arthrobacter TaxID=1663 RepID=B8R4M0_ARTGO|nr:putative lipoprotein [Arthrobacter globiformis]